jgi:hypothetical protein
MEPAIFLKGPNKTQTTFILITGLILSIGAFSFTTLLLLNQTEYFDGGIDRGARVVMLVPSKLTK